MTEPAHSAVSLVKALAVRHADDVFVPECKDGATQTRSHKRLDAWVLRKTWSPITTIGYEVKVSRSDWRRDEKIDTYAGLCHLLFVVAPKGVVEVAELPLGVGLLEPVGDGSRLVTRRKPTRREVDIPTHLLLYVLMCRVDIKSEQPTWDYRSDRREWRVKELREWLEKKDERRAMSYAISEKIRAQFDKQEAEISRLTRRMEELEQVERRIVELGFDPKQGVNSWQVFGRLNALGKIIEPHML